MIKVKYDEYVNDYCIHDKERSFYSWTEFEDWFFGLCKGKYADKISLPNPDKTHIWEDGPSAMEVNCCWEEGKTYRVHLISTDMGIVFSDGRLTDRQRHWNDEMKEKLRKMIQRKTSPVFNFA